jgi:ABC-2 type transport system ATP-binding protein
MIRMSNIVKSFGNHTVLSDVSFEVNEREIFGLLGPSGAGKTTIINILTHQLDADSGEHITSATPFETGLMLDQDGLYSRLNCLQNLNVFADIYGISHQQSMAALESVGIQDAAKRPVSALSRGMRQRLALARAILHEPKVLFLDEPTSGLDPATARGIHKLIISLRDNGTTIFLTTHNMDEAVRLCDQVALLHMGVIIEQGAPIEICERYHAIKTVPDLEAVFFLLTGAELESDVISEIQQVQLSASVNTSKGAKSA